MTTNQGNIIATIETKLGLSGLNYNEAIMELAKDAGIAETDFNSMFQQYLTIATGSTETNINGLLAAYSTLFFDGNVNSINDLTFGSSFSPTDISGTVLWLDLQDNSTILDSGGLPCDDTDSIAKIVSKDTDATNHDAEQGTASARPMYKTSLINSLPGMVIVSGDGMPINNTANNPDFTAPHTIFSVLIQNGGNNAPLYQKGRAFSTSSNYDWSVYTTSAKVFNYKQTSDSGTIAFASAPYVSITGVPILSAMGWDGTLDTNKVFNYFNGTLVTNTATSTLLTNDEVLAIGRSPAGGSSVAADFGEIIMYNRVLTSDEIDEVMGYLSDKWNISI